MTKKPTKRQRSKGFREKVLDIVRKIPKGRILTYKEVATLAGSSGGARAVGSIMSRNFDHAIPCHRVVRSDGKIGDYNRGGEKVKIKKLKEEGAIR
jgi:O-6-methylguanine DNA methyltransferase